MNKKRGISIEQAAEIRAQRGADRPCKLRALRVAKGYSQADLARESGVVLKTLQRFERIPADIDKTRLETFFALCRALDCKIADLIEDEEVLKEFEKYAVKDKAEEPIIRCENCKHFVRDSQCTESGYYCGYHSFAHEFVEMFPGDFCSCGEEK